MQATLEEYVTDRIIHSYRDDPDLQNFIDFAQQQVSIVISFSQVVPLDSVVHVTIIACLNRGKMTDSAFFLRTVPMLWTKFRGLRRLVKE